MDKPHSGDGLAAKNAVSDPEPLTPDDTSMAEGSPETAHAQAVGRRSVRTLLRMAALPGVAALALAVVATGQADVLRSVRFRAPATDVERLEAENRALRIEIELATREEPYMVVNLAGPSLTLKSHGVPLRSFPVQATRVRARRLLGVWTRSMPVLDTVWGGGTLLPPRKLERVVILSDTVSPPDKDGTVSFVPPTPEEETPTLPVFRVRYQGGLSAIVVAGPAEPAPADTIQPSEPAPVMVRTSLFGSLVLWIGTKPWRRDQVRIELTLPSTEAGALYRAFTDGTPLLVIGTG